jgi:N-acetylglutamate synthase-like GNAT family acetyltransferase
MAAIEPQPPVPGQDNPNPAPPRPEPPSPPQEEPPNSDRPDIVPPVPTPPIRQAEHSAKDSEISRLTAKDPGLISLLQGAGLPTSDLGTHDGQQFIGLYEGTDLVAAGGLEIYGDCALLRSVVVARDQRGTGKGRAISEFILDQAHVQRLAALYLLTTTAEHFFRRLGFEPVERSSVPDAIRRTPEFSELCPSSAVVMRRRTPR